MPEKKNELAGNKPPKKSNLSDHNSVKHVLDECVTEVVASKGYPEDVRMSNTRLLIGMAIIVVALFAQFYKKKFPENRDFLILFTYLKGRSTILVTNPPEGSFGRTGLVVASKLPKFSDMYTLAIRSADPQSKSANPSVEFTRSVTRWFTKEGVLVEGLLWKDVEGLIDDYAEETKKSN